MQKVIAFLKKLTLEHCWHKWYRLTEARPGAGAIYKCRKCRQRLSASEYIQIKQLRRNTTFAFLGFLLALTSFLFVVYNYFFLEKAMIGVDNFVVKPTTREIDGKNVQCLGLDYNIANYGKVPAEDLDFEVYMIPIDLSQPGQKQWSNGVAGVIFPGTSLSLAGGDYICPSEDNLGKANALIFDFHYYGSILGRMLGEKSDSQLMFQHCIGNCPVEYLLKTEKDKIWKRYLELRDN